MATAYTQEHGKDNFVVELNSVKEKVRTTLKELRECLSEREDELMKELNDILSRYLSYNTEVKKVDEQRRDIENTRNALLAVVVTSTAVKTFNEDMLQKLNQQLEQLKLPAKPNSVRFVCDKNQLLCEVNKLCKLVKSVNEMDYAGKTQPMVSVCDKGTGNDPNPANRQRPRDQYDDHYRHRDIRERDFPYEDDIEMEMMERREMERMRMRDRDMDRHMHNPIERMHMGQREEMNMERYRNTPGADPFQAQAYQPPPAPALPLPTSQWSCPHCTLINEAYKRICEGCYKTYSGPTPTSVEATHTDKPSCPTCFAIVPLGSKVCPACGRGIF